jgi:large subunit ribosomal protein L10
VPVVTVKVAKNRLAKLALKETDHADISGLFTGPTVDRLRGKDPMTAPKIAAKLSLTRTTKYVVLGGAMGKTALDANSVKALATMPSLERAPRHARRDAQAARDPYRVGPAVAPAGGSRTCHLAAHAEKSNAA